jgi:hypothetical protein
MAFDKWQNDSPQMKQFSATTIIQIILIPGDVNAFLWSAVCIVLRSMVPHIHAQSPPVYV